MIRRLLVASTLILLSGGATAASAQPVRTHDATPGTLSIAIQTIAPLAPRHDSTLIVSGRVTNTGTTPVYGGSIALDDSGYVASRTELAAFEDAPGTLGQPLASEALPKELAAHRSVAFELRVPELGRFVPDGEDERVLRMAVVASSAAAKGAGIAPLGVTAVPTPYFDAQIISPLQTALIIPITAVPDQGPVPMSGAPAQPPSSDLINALQPDGRLGKLLSVMEAAPASGGGGETQLTVAIDPALLTRVCALAGLCGQNIAFGTPSMDSVVAGAWLKRLFADVELSGVTVVGLPKADADLAALSAAGATSTVIGLLKDAATVPAGIPGATTTEVQPFLPVDGLADAALASEAAQAGSTVAVVSANQFAPVVPASMAPVTPSASTTLESGLSALVMDPVLESLLVPSGPGTLRLQEQHLLTELAVITSELPNSPHPRTVVLEAPRDWDVPLSFSTNLVSALGAVPYVKSLGLQTVSTAPPTLRTRLRVQPTPVSPLPVSTIETVNSERSQVLALKLVAAGPKEILSAPFGDGLDRALSAWWRGSGAKMGAALLTSVTNNITSTTDKVSVKGSDNGVLLTGPSGKLPVQVRNQLNESIAVVVHVKSDGVGQVTGRDVSQVLPPGGTAPYQISVPITTRSTRSVNVTMQLLTRSGGQQIADATIPVRSTSVGKVAVGITAAALTLLVLLILVRGIRRFAAHRRSLSATASP